MTEKQNDACAASPAELLLAWYDREKRDLPWRGIHDPYRTWVSEVMLQQTRVETVIPYYHRFMQAFPTLAVLAAAPEEQVLKLWEGLGYYSRARNLQSGARQVMENYAGQLPEDVAELRKVKGIGPYTAGAIASIAMGLPAAAVDGNVIRVISRLTGLRENAGLPSVRRELEKRVLALMPSSRPGDFNQAMMDLGARICLPGTPDCEHCPLRSVCDAFRAGDAEELPFLPDKAAPKQIYYDLFLIFRDRTVLMAPRSQALLKGLWCFPLSEYPPSDDETDSLPAELTDRMYRETGLQALSTPLLLGHARHVFTHRIWQMRVWRVDACTGIPDGSWRFLSAKELRALPLPTAVRYARDEALHALQP